MGPDADGMTPDVIAEIMRRIEKQIAQRAASPAVVAEGTDDAE